MGPVFCIKRPCSRSRRAQKGERFGRFAPRHDSRPEWSSIGSSSHRGRWPVRCRCGFAKGAARWGRQGLRCPSGSRAVFCVRPLWWTDKLSTSRTDAKRRQRTSSGQSMLMMLYCKKRKTFLGVKKAVGFPVFYRTLRTLAGQAFRRSSPSKRRTELVAGETKKPENRRGFPFYSSGASNPKGSGAQYCSPPATVFGIETIPLRHRKTKFT